MEHSRMYEKIKTWYEKGIWTYAQVEASYQKGLITEEEFIEITQKN